MFKTAEDHGRALKDEFDSFIASHTERASARLDTVNARLAALEAEEAELHALAARLQATQAAA